MANYYHFKPDEIRGLRLKQLKILAEINAICEQLGINYFLFSGTLLGAVRHDGYIPWDDDLDLGMEAADFRRFVEEGPALFSEHLKLDWLEICPAWGNSFAKVRDVSTTYVEACDANKAIFHGVFVDVFPVYRYPTSFFSRLRLKFWSKVLFSKVFRQSYAYQKGWTRHPFKQRASNWLVDTMTFFVSSQKAAKKYWSLGERYSAKFSNAPLSFCGCYTRGALFPSAATAETIAGKFEGVSTYLPIGTRSVLKAFYGDYMTPPPPEKQIGMHYCVAFDLERGCDEPYIFVEGERRRD